LIQNQITMKYLIFSISLLLSLFLSDTLLAQDALGGHGRAEGYNSAAGVRGGLYYGVSYKQALGEKAYGEAIVSANGGFLRVTGLYEITNETGAEGFRWYYGAGITAGALSGFRLGPTAVIGVEFSVSEIPLNASIDYMPSLWLLNTSLITGRWSAGAISVRYILN